MHVDAVSEGECGGEEPDPGAMAHARVDSCCCSNGARRVALEEVRRVATFSGEAHKLPPPEFSSASRPFIVDVRNSAGDLPDGILRSTSAHCCLGSEQATRPKSHAETIVQHFGAELSTGARDRSDTFGDCPSTTRSTSIREGRVHSRVR